MKNKCVSILLCLYWFLLPIHGAKPSVSFMVMTQDHNPIENASFQLMEEGIGYIMDISSDANGLVCIEDLNGGTYHIIQKATASGYEINKDSWSFAYEEGEQLKLKDVINQKKVGKALLQIVDERNQPQKHYTFSVWNEAHTIQKQYQSDKDGYCLLEHLNLETYQIDIEGRFVDLAITDHNYQGNYEMKLYTKQKQSFKPKKQDYSLWILGSCLFLACVGIGIYSYRWGIFCYLQPEESEEEEE